MTFSGSANMKETKSRNVKDSWESEFGYGWKQSNARRCRAHRPPESTLSVSSDIRFTRRKLTRPCQGCCAAAAAMLILMLLTAVAVYLGHMYLFGDPLNRQIFRGSFVVSSWGDGGGEAGGGRGNHSREGDLRQALLDVYKNSQLRSCFVSAEILALDTAEEGTRVHFEVSFEPIFTSVGTGEVAAALSHELHAPTAPALLRLQLLPETLHIEENTVISSQGLDDLDTTPADAPSTEAATAEAVEELRECSPLTLPLCKHLPYNITSYPNLVGHANKEVLLRDLVAFRELLDAECSHLAQDFVCEMLQPRCSEGRLLRPCRAYCRAFHAGCGARLPDRLKPHFDCSRFPDYFGPGSCLPEPECHSSLQRLALSRRACDGVPDCADAQDERACAHCAAAGGRGLRCALNTRCLPQHLRCDGTPDCPDGSDEAGCLWVSRSLASWRREAAETTLGAVRSRAGYAVWAERGRAGKVCAAPYEHDRKALLSVANSLCRALTFKSASNAEVVHDAEAEDADTDEESAPEYVEVVDPAAPEISFLKSDCPERRVVRVVCDQLECGTASARGPRARAGVQGLPRSALPGDWPWHAALLRTHVHACDAALVHPAWLITTASCFQGQPKAEWTARLGSVRIQSTSPWQQERRIVGMVRSPVEGSMLALVRLEEPLEMTDFVRPACLPETGPGAAAPTVCNTLGWTRNRDQLQRIHVVPSPMQSCENASIATANGLCAEPLYDQDDCDEEEYAGSSMMCFDEKTKHWSLVGVSGWRIACTKIGLGRPRIYDSVSSHVDWIRRTISNSAR
ncbi:atrial natriuretic peptide-converting enzyme [Plutella xylostella]|uniref:atrial natriuretic peptide-converting enzyme n=1 Tax=Plutella xylostella TaxID=51655 RepID=UPI0020330354|nr:atrial natriuretic peptide-converting enzyme [Plutella xylostella]